MTRRKSVRKKRPPTRSRKRRSSTKHRKHRRAPNRRSRAPKRKRPSRNRARTPVRGARRRRRTRPSIGARRRRSRMEDASTEYRYHNWSAGDIRREEQKLEREKETEEERRREQDTSDLIGPEVYGERIEASPDRVKREFHECKHISKVKQKKRCESNVRDVWANHDWGPLPGEMEKESGCNLM